VVNLWRNNEDYSKSAEEQIIGSDEDMVKKRKIRKTRM
jgi:hypothetical protein